MEAAQRATKPAKPQGEGGPPLLTAIKYSTLYRAGEGAATLWAVYERDVCIESHRVEWGPAGLRAKKIGKNEGEG